MSSIAEGIQHVLDQARKEREQAKLASAEENRDPALDSEIKSTANLAGALKTASENIRELSGDVRVRDVSNLLENLGRDDI